MLDDRFLGAGRGSVCSRRWSHATPRCRAGCHARVCCGCAPASRAGCLVQNSLPSAYPGGDSKARATAHAGSIFTPAAVLASLGALDSREVACGAGVAMMTWLKGPCSSPSASSRCQCFSPRIRSVIWQVKLIGNWPSSASGDGAHARGAHPAGLLVRGGGQLAIFIVVQMRFPLDGPAVGLPLRCTSSTKRRSRAVKY
jgi:hypothetical protein